MIELTQKGIVHACCILAFSASPIAAQACERLQTSESRELIDVLERASAVSPVWDDYSLANHPVVLIPNHAIRCSHRARRSGGVASHCNSFRRPAG